MLKQFRWDGLRTKIIAWSFVPTAIILGAVALFTYMAYQQVTEDLVVQRNAELSRLSANQLAFELDKYTDILINETRPGALHDPNPNVRQDALVRARNRLAIFDAGTLLVNTRGIVVGAYPERPDLFLQDFSRQPFYREMLHYPAPYYSNIMPYGIDGAEVLVIAVPIIGDLGEFDGALLGMFELGATSISALYGDIVKLRIEVTCCAMLVDGSGRAIYHTELDRIGQDLSNQDVVQRALAGEVGAVRTLDITNQASVASFAPVPGTGWAIITQESWANLTRAGQGYQRFLTLLLAMGVLIPGLVVAMGVRRITKPLEDLSHAAQDVAGGNFTQIAVARTGDEIETLGAQFNTMSAELQSLYTHLERRVEERTRELATLNAVAEVVSRSLDLDEILNDALSKVLEVLHIDAGGIYLLEPSGETLTLNAHSGLSPDFAEELETVEVEQSFFIPVSTRGEPLVVEDINTNPRMQKYTADWRGFNTVALFPLTARGNTFGALFVMNHERRVFEKQDLDLIMSISRQIAVATENARLFKAEQRRANQFRFIAEVGRQIVTILDADELMREIVQLVYDTFGYYLVTIGLVEDGQVVFKAGKKTGWPEEQFRPAALALDGPGITALVASSGKAHLAEDVSTDPTYLFWPDAAETRSELCLPLKTKTGVIGVLNLESTLTNDFDDSDQNVLQSIAQQAAIAIENAQLFGQAQELAVVQERQRLARDLHDSVTQALYGVTLYAEATTRQLAQAEPNLRLAQSHLAELRSTAQEALREMRLLIFELRPSVLAQEGLANALRHRLESVEGRSGVRVSFAQEGDLVPLSQKTEATLYWMAQEVLNNTLKHAQAGLIDVTLRQNPDCLQLTIKDDGVGFSAEEVHNQGGLGLPGMRERAAEIGARLDIMSSPGTGTTVTIEVVP